MTSSATPAAYVYDTLHKSKFMISYFLASYNLYFEILVAEICRGSWRVKYFRTMRENISECLFQSFPTVTVSMPEQNLKREYIMPFSKYKAVVRALMETIFLLFSFMPLSACRDFHFKSYIDDITI